MGSVVLDVTTRGLDEAIANVAGAKNLITAGTAVRMAAWYNSNFKRTALKIIDSGEGMAANAPKYARWKANQYGVTHPLGRLTGKMYMMFSMTQPNVKETRGTEVRLAVTFNKPEYIAYVIDGRSGQPKRDFVTVAKEKEWQALLKSLGRIFDNLDFTRPYPELLSTVMGPSDLPSLRSYG